MSHSQSALWWQHEKIAEPASGPLASKSSDSRIPFGALMAFTFILLLAPQLHFRGLAELRIALLSALVGALAFLIDRFWRRKPLRLLTREMVLVGALAGWAVLGVPFSYWPGGSVDLLLGLYFKTLVIFWLMGNVVSTLERMRKIAWGLSLMSIPLALTAVINYLQETFVPGGVPRPEGYDAPLTGNPNDLALLLNLVLPLTASLFLVQRRTTARMLLIGVMLLDVVAVMLTFSRAGFVTLTILCLVGLLRLKSWLKRLSVIAAMILVVFFLWLFSDGYTERLRSILDIEADPTGSAQARWSDTLAALRLVARNPIIGAGAGMNILALNEERGPRWRLIHNVYLEYAVDLGLPGLCLFMALLVTCVKKASFVRKRCQSLRNLRELFHFSRGVETSLIAFSVAALFYPVAYQFFFYYFAGLAVAVRVIYDKLAADASLTPGSPATS